MVQSGAGGRTEATDPSGVLMEIALRLPSASMRALLILVRKRIRELEKESRRPAHQRRTQAIIDAERFNADAYRLDRFRELEDRLNQALEGEHAS